MTVETQHGTVSQRTRLTTRQRQIQDDLGLPEPPRYFDFAPIGD